MKHIGKKMIMIAALAASLAVAAPMTGITALAVDETGNVLSENTFTATVTRTTAGALLVTPDSSANLGDSLAVTYANASNFAVGDVVTITYSGEVTDSGNSGTKAIKADSIVKSTGGASTTEEANTPVVTSNESDNTPVTPVVSTTNDTPNTGDTGVVAIATAGVLSGTVLILKKAGKAV